jgi:protein-tyrosine phosphatase
VDELVARITAGGHVVVHCRAGIGRSSLIAAVVLVRLGVDVDVAWEVVAAARGVPVPETDDQRRWVQRYGPQP